MGNIVIYEKIQWLFFTRNSHDPCFGKVARRDIFNDVDQMGIILAPEIYKLILFEGIIIRERNPFVLIVINGRLVLELDPYKPLMVIGSAINQVAQYFFFAPLARGWFLDEFRFGNLPEQGRNGVNQVLHTGQTSINAFIFRAAGINIHFERDLVQIQI